MNVTRGYTKSRTKGLRNHAQEKRHKKCHDISLRGSTKFTSITSRLQSSNTCAKRLGAAFRRE